MSQPGALAALIGRGPLLLDFDGPVCSIFAGLPAPQVAAELVEVLRGAAVEVPAAVAAEPDPMAVLQWTGATCGPGLTLVVDDALRDLETRAVAVAAPTPFGHEVITAARAAGLAVAVVSNNSGPAVSAYLSIHGLDEYVSPVVGPDTRPAGPNEAQSGADPRRGSRPRRKSSRLSLSRGFPQRHRGSTGGGGQGRRLRQSASQGPGISACRRCSRDDGERVRGADPSSRLTRRKTRATEMSFPVSAQGSAAAGRAHRSGRHLVGGRGSFIKDMASTEVLPLWTVAATMAWPRWLVHA